MQHHTIRRLLLVLPVIWIAAGPASAQYDKDGRYVPSPNGIPADPYARPIPGYSGTPGQANGTPIEPRASIPQVPPVAPLKVPELTPRASRDSPRPLPIPVTEAQCRKGWSGSTGLSRREFAQWCDLVLDR